jgi:hypothetical protein
MARDIPPDEPAALLDETNRTLHDAIQMIDDANNKAALVTLQGLANRWEAASDRPHLVLLSSAGSANE